MNSARGTRPRGDRGDIVLGWLTRLAATLAVLGVVGFDGVSLGAAQFQAADAAGVAARAAAEEYRSSHDVQKAYDAAYATALPHGDTVGTTDFRVAQDGSVTLTLTRTASTLLVEKVGPLKRYAKATAEGTGRPAS